MATARSYANLLLHPLISLDCFGLSLQVRGQARFVPLRASPMLTPSGLGTNGPQLLRNDGFASSGGKRLCPLPAFGCSHQSAITRPSRRGASNTPRMWIVAFESPFGCLESVNLILGQNLERIPRLLRRVLVVESFVKVSKVSCVSDEALQLA